MITQPKTLKGFIDKFNERGLGLVAKRNDNGHICEATYVDRGEMVVISGPKPGSDFSASILNELFGNAQENNTDRVTQTDKVQRWGYSSLSHRSNTSGEDWKKISWQKYLRRKYNKVK